MRSKIIFLFVILASVQLSVNVHVFGDEAKKLSLIKKISRTCFAAYTENARIRFNKDGGYYETKKGEFEPTSLMHIIDVFDAYLKPGMKFLDLGSGDGRVLFFASHYKVQATGIEFDQELVEISRKALARLSDHVDRESVDIIQGDFLKHDFTDYDVFYIFEGTWAVQKLVGKLSKEMKAGSLLIAYASYFNQKRFPKNLKVVKQYIDTPVVVYKKITE